jgi:hypothetical protein
MILAVMSGCGADPPAAPDPATLPANVRDRVCPDRDQGRPTLPVWKLLSRSESDAKALAKQHGCVVRVVIEDGEWDEGLSGDLVSNRIDVELRDGYVVRLVTESG